MSRPNAFVLPDGLRLTVGADSLSVQHDGDVVLEQTLGRRLGRLEAGGDVTLRFGRFSGSVRAGGTLSVDADIDAEELRADVIEIGEGEVTARAIVATTRIVIGRARLAVDVIVAPEVHLDAQASGRVRVVDCLNDRPSTRVRGCLSLADYQADFGDVAEFLSRRGVEPVSALPPPAEDTDRHLAVPTLAPSDEGEIATPLDTDPDVDGVDVVLPLDVVEDARGVEGPHPAQPALPSPARPGTPSRAVRQVEKAWLRMQEAYGGDVPAPVARIGDLLEAGHAEAVLARVDELWVATLRAHLQARTPPPRPVTLAFHGLRAQVA